MSGPRFEESDFFARDENADSEKSLGISERGLELLKNINEMIDLVTKQQAGGPNLPIVIQLSEK